MYNPFSSTDTVDEDENDDVDQSLADSPATDSPAKETARHHASSYRVIDRPADHRIDQVVKLLTDPTDGVVTRAGAIAVVKRQTEQEIHGFVKELDTLLRQRETALIGIDHNTPMLRTVAKHVGLTLAVAPHNEEYVSTLCRHLTALVTDDRVSGLGSARRFEVPVSTSTEVQESSRVFDALENLRGEPLHHIGNDDWDFVAFTAPERWVSTTEETLSAFAPVIDQVVWDRPRITVCGFVFGDSMPAPTEQAKSSMQTPTNGKNSSRATSADSSRNSSQSTETAQESRSTQPDTSSKAGETDLAPPPENGGAPTGASSPRDSAGSGMNRRNDGTANAPPTESDGSPTTENGSTSPNDPPATTSTKSAPTESASDSDEKPTLPDSPATENTSSATDPASAETQKPEHSPDTISPPPTTGDDTAPDPGSRPTDPPSDPESNATNKRSLPQPDNEPDDATATDSQGASPTDEGPSPRESPPSSAPGSDADPADSQRGDSSDEDSVSPSSPEKDSPNGPHPGTDQSAESSSTDLPTIPGAIPEGGDDTKQSQDDTTGRRSSSSTVPSGTSPSPAASDDDDSASPSSPSVDGDGETASSESPTRTVQIPSPPGGTGPGLVPAGDAPASRDPGVVDIDEHVLNEIGSHAVAHDGEVGHDGQEVYATLYCDDQGLIRHSHIVEDERFLEKRRSSISFKRPFYRYLQYLAQIYQTISHRLCGDVHSHPGGSPKQSPADESFSQRVWNNPRRNHNFIIALDNADDGDPDQWTVTDDGREVQKQVNGHLLRIRAFAGGTNEPKQIRVHTTMGI